MAPLPYQPNLILIKPQYLDPSGRVHENITWWTGSIAASYSSAQLTAIGGELNVNWPNAWAKIGATDATYTGCIVQDYTSATGLAVTVTASAPGTFVGNAAPQNTAVLISNHGSTRYRGGHSRTYLPCISSAITTDGINVANTSTTPWTTFVTDWNAIIPGMFGISAPNGGPVLPVIYHGRRHSVAPYLEQIQTQTIQTKLASQRRRLRKAPHH